MTRLSTTLFICAILFVSNCSTFEVFGNRSRLLADGNKNEIKHPNLKENTNNKQHKAHTFS